MGSASLKVNEPSMEEILASIRRIIADDHEAVQPAEPEKPESSPLKNVLDIAELHVSPLIGSTPNEPVLGPWNRGEMSLDEDCLEDGSEEDLVSFREPEEPVQAPVAIPEPVLKSAPSMAPVEAESLLSNEASAAVSGAFERLGASMQPSRPQTVEDLMKEMLRPMLKAWLDDNLPSLVERLVRGEIERVSRSRG
jgi:cell pole-organizing protein PopZ